MAVALELLVNETVNCLADMNVKMIANVKMVTVQNRIALDSVLAPKKRGTCPLVGFECCTYCSDKSKYIEEEEVANFHNYCTDDGIFFLTRRDFLFEGW